MADFFTEYKKTSIREGGYSNRASDKGGETIFGIARNYHPEWAGWAKVDVLKVSPDFPAVAERNPELQSLAGQFYKDNNWNRYHLDEFRDQLLAGMVFDTSINCGEHFAAVTLQEALNYYGATLAVDGVVGPATMSAVKVFGNSRTSADLIIGRFFRARIKKRVKALEGEDIKALPEDSQYRNIKGWLKRDLELF